MRLRTPRRLRMPARLERPEQGEGGSEAVIVDNIISYSII